MPESCPIQLSVRTLARDIYRENISIEGRRAQVETKLWNQNILQRLFKSQETALVEVKESTFVFYFLAYIEYIYKDNAPTLNNNYKLFQSLVNLTISILTKRKTSDWKDKFPQRFLFVFHLTL